MVRLTFLIFVLFISCNFKESNELVDVKSDFENRTFNPKNTLRYYVVIPERRMAPYILIDTLLAENTNFILFDKKNKIQTSILDSICFQFSHSKSQINFSDPILDKEITILNEKIFPATGKVYKLFLDKGSSYFIIYSIEYGILLKYTGTWYCLLDKIIVDNECKEFHNVIQEIVSDEEFLFEK